MVAVGFHSHWLNGIDYMGQFYKKGVSICFICTVTIILFLSYLPWQKGDVWSSFFFIPILLCPMIYGIESLLFVGRGWRCWARRTFYFVNLVDFALWEGPIWWRYYACCCLMYLDGLEIMFVKTIPLPGGYCEI
jgi:hypothetical protein